MRKPDCTAYPECLTRAAHQNAPGLPCGTCGDYEPQDMCWLYHVEIAGILALLLALDDEPDQANDRFWLTGAMGRASVSP